MDELLSRIDVCKAILDTARRFMYSPIRWEVNPFMWREIARECRPAIEVEIIGLDATRLFGIPVDVSVKYPGIDLRVTKHPH